MSTARRASRRRLTTAGGWPVDLDNADAPAWRSDSAMARWLDDIGAQVRGNPTMNNTADERQLTALRSWVYSFHPSERWSNFVDNAWMNSSGLRKVEQAVARRVWARDLRGDDQ